MNKTNVMLAAGFRPTTWKDLQDNNPLMVTQIANESCTPDAGRHHRSNGTMPYCSLVAPTEDAARKAVDGSLFEVDE